MSCADILLQGRSTRLKSASGALPDRKAAKLGKMTEHDHRAEVASCVRREFSRDGGWSTTTFQKTQRLQLPEKKILFASRSQEEHW
jgi:hypothetical protein